MNIIKSTKKKSEKKYVKDNLIFLKKKKIKGKKRPEKDIKILLRKKKKKGVRIIKNVKKKVPKCRINYYLIHKD